MKNIEVDCCVTWLNKAMENEQGKPQNKKKDKEAW